MIRQVTFGFLISMMSSCLCFYGPMWSDANKWFDLILIYMSGNRSKSAFFEGGGSLWTQISEGRGRRRPTNLGIRVAEWLPFRVVSKYLQCVIYFCHNARVWQTDRRTDRRTELRLPRPPVAYARALKTFITNVSSYNFRLSVGLRR